MVDDAQALSLPSRDKWEYFGNQTGYGVDEALDVISVSPLISENADKPIAFGIVRNCHMLHFHIPAETPYELLCPDIRHDWPSRPARDLTAVLSEHKAVYVILEEFGGEEFAIRRHLVQADWELIESFQRPFGGVFVNLYIVTQNDEAPWLPFFGG